MNHPVLLRAQGLFKRFGPSDNPTTVLNDVNIALESGSLTLLMGPSGSGKSTLLAALAGLQQPDSGTVDFNGQNIWQHGARSAQRFRQTHCGFVFQHVHLIPFLTAAEQIAFLLKQTALDKIEVMHRTEHYLAAVGLGDKQQCLPAQLSGGEQQRVAIARALALKPTLIFADEPTSALDSENGRRVAELLYHVAAEDGTTVLAVTHDSRIKDLAERVITMTDGKTAETQI